MTQTEMFRITGMDFIINSLELLTHIGRKKLKETEFTFETKKISQELERMEKFQKFARENSDTVKLIKEKLVHVRDIINTIKRLDGGYVLDDIELFEIKAFSLVSEEIYDITKEILDYLAPSSLLNPIEILDPEGYKIPSFYVCDAYSERLSSIRKQKRQEKAKETPDETKINDLVDLEAELEDEIREELTEKLKKYSEDFWFCINRIAYLDLIIAKTDQAEKYGFIKPEISEEKTSYIKIFNPEIKEALNAENKEYQKIDVEITSGVTVITGANMSGKTVVLKTAALAQFMFQMGFFVPAEKAVIKPVEKIFLMTGDFQSALSGLSSYAAEMLYVNEAVTYVKSGKTALVLLDELARTTNPHEGKAIVKSVIRILKKYNCLALITTHYDGVTLNENIRKLRVVGLRKDKITGTVNAKNIGEYIDYGLIEESAEEKLPEEAITIAKLLNIDEELISNAESIVRSM